MSIKEASNLNRTFIRIQNDLSYKTKRWADPVNVGGIYRGEVDLTFDWFYLLCVF